MKTTWMLNEVNLMHFQLSWLCSPVDVWYTSFSHNSSERII